MSDALRRRLDRLKAAIGTLYTPDQIREMTFREYCQAHAAGEIKFEEWVAAVSYWDVPENRRQSPAILSSRSDEDEAWIRQELDECLSLGR